MERKQKGVPCKCTVPFTTKSYSFKGEQNIFFTLVCFPSGAYFGNNILLEIKEKILRLTEIFSFILATETGLAQLNDVSSAGYIGYAPCLYKGTHLSLKRWA